MPFDYDLAADGFETGLVGTIGYRLTKDDGTEAAARTTAGIIEAPASSGLYQTNGPVTIPDDAVYAVWDDDAGRFARVHLSDVRWLNFVQKVEANGWKLDTVGDEWVVYDDDGTTVIARFSLLNSAGGSPDYGDLAAVFERVKGTP